MENQEVAWLLQEKYHGQKTEAFLSDCSRLREGTPLAYLIGQIPFLNCTIHLDSHPLIPRVETEFWTERAIQYIKSSPLNLRDETLKILDLCAGSGAIGVALAKAVPGADVTFAEIDASHLPTIEKNILSNLDQIAPGFPKYVVRESDLFSKVIGQFDFILTNPPYIDVAAHTVAANVAAHEPHLALFGGIAGMELITRIIVDAKKYLCPNGQLWIEHEPAQVAAITALAHAQQFSIVTHPDQYETPRVSVLSMAQ